MTYETLARFAQQGGSLYFLLLFVAGFGYAFWPRNRETFQRAKHLPLTEEADHD